MNINLLKTIQEKDRSKTQLIRFIYYTRG